MNYKELIESTTAATDPLDQRKFGDPPLTREKLIKEIAALKNAMMNAVPDRYYPAVIRMHPETRSRIGEKQMNTLPIWEPHVQGVSYKIIYDSSVEIGKFVICNNSGFPIPTEKLIEYGFLQKPKE